MKRYLQLICQSLVVTAVLVSCGKVNHQPTGMMSQAYPTLTLSQMNSQAMNISDQQRDALARQMIANGQLEQPAKIDLAAVSEKIVETQAKLLKALDQKTTPQDNLSQVEIQQIRQWMRDLKDEIQAEDQSFSQSAGKFAVKTAQAGKDVDIEMFLYHPTYGSRAKFWGIETAHDFLQAGRSPFRRWLLKKKLEGFFAPAGFAQQILFWVEQADLMRISGVSREDAFLLVSQGITSVPDLARRNIIELATMRLSMAVLAFSYGFDAPSMSEIEDWADEAKTLEPVIY